jgi:hypothetical protein
LSKKIFTRGHKQARKTLFEIAIVRFSVHACNPSNQEAEAGESPV